MTTLSTMINTCRQTLGDTVVAYTFTDSQLTSWVQHAIRDISQYLPLQVTASVNISAGLASPADLPAGFISAISVKRTSPTPVAFLLRLPITDPDFPYHEGYYDIRQEDTHSHIYLSGAVASQTVSLVYNAEHTVPVNGTDILTIPGRHEPLIPLFVRWKAWEQVTTIESQTDKYATSGDGSGVVALHMGGSEYERATQLAGEAYRQAIHEALQALTASAASGGWSMDKYDNRRGGGGYYG